MLEPTKKRPTERVNLQVICDKSKLAKVKAALQALNCTVRPAKPAQRPDPGEHPDHEATEVQWLTIEDLFPESNPGEALRAYRYRENLTQKQLAVMVGISVPNLSHMEHGRRPIGKEMAKRLAKTLNTDWRLLLD